MRGRNDMNFKNTILNVFDRYPALPAVLSGLTALFVFKLVLGFFPEAFYIDRDDGIITLSHARNWIDFGFIGVNPSGERVEGFSSPLQFLIFACLSLFGTLHYSLFFSIQWWVSTFLFGFVLYRVFEVFFEKERNLGFGWAFTACALLSVSFTFLAWHASGMENCWVHLLYLSYAFVLFRILNGNPIHVALSSLILFFATIVRIESVYHLFPISITFLYLSYKNRIPWKETLPLWIAGFLWSLFFAGRYLYFGRIFPNTSTAQEVSLLENLNHLLRLDSSLAKNWEIFRFGFKQNLVLLIPLSLLLFFFKRIDRRESLFAILLMSLAIPGLLHAFILGNYRLDPARPMTWLAVIGVILFLIRIRSLTEKRRIWVLPIVLIAGFISYKNYKFKSYDLCCSSKIFEQRRTEISELAKKEEIKRPLVAIADLGVLSFYKEFNILDLGYLGNKFLAKNKKDVALIESYLSLSRPDILEIHFPWSCEYSKFLNNQDFAKHYRLAFDSSEKPPIAVCPDGGKVVTGTFLFKSMAKGSKTVDREIYSRFTEEISANTVRAEIGLCNDQNDRCLSLIRNVYRFLPELQMKIQNSEWKAIAALFKNPTYKDYFELVRKYDSPTEDLVSGIFKSSKID